MKAAVRVSALLLLASVGLPGRSEAGAYFLVPQRSRLLPPADTNRVPSSAIVHPYGYSGGGGTVQVRVCLLPGAERFVGPLEEAIETWNDLRATTENCPNCLLVEEGGTPATVANAYSVLLHELGHCGLGLGHPNLIEVLYSPSDSSTLPAIFRTGECDVDSDSVCGEATSFTSSNYATEVVATDTVRGNPNDDHLNQCPFIPARLQTSAATPEAAPWLVETSRQPEICEEGLVASPGACLAPFNACQSPPVCCPACPGPDCPVGQLQVQDHSWFRIVDNNPAIVDATVIDSTTFTRNASQLPIGHNYAANSNRAANELLGVAFTQAAMYSNQIMGTVYQGLSADDVNMVKMADTGADRLAGTADDYRVQLLYQATCTGAQVEIGTAALGTRLGLCDPAALILAPSFSQAGVKLHWSLSPQSGVVLPLTMNNTLETALVAGTWDYGNRIHASKFEGGDTGEWLTSP